MRVAYTSAKMRAQFTARQKGSMLFCEGEHAIYTLITFIVARFLFVTSTARADNLIQPKLNYLE